MAHVNLVHSPLLPIVGDAVVVLGVLGEVMSECGFSRELDQIA
jgi:hypothetical protein